MKLINYSLIAVLLTCSFLITACARSEAPAPWEQQTYQNIIASSANIKNDQLPLSNTKLDHRLGFLTSADVHKYDIDNVIIILGNMPLDESTPTIDMTYRTLKGVELLKTNPNSLMIITGGKTAGRISEAEMMGLIAWSRGIDSKRILLEENSKTTAENAQFTAELLRKFFINKAYLVSKIEHLEWAVPYFKEYGIFKNIVPVDCGVSFEQIVLDMENYLKIHDNDVVRQRLENVKRDYKGVD